MKHESLWRPLYPFESHMLDLNGVRYHYLDEGSGEPLLLVHGNPTWSFYWRELVKGLRDRYRLIVPDHVGCGLSDKPAAYEYRLATHIENLRRLVDALRLERITLVAHDWGGAIGLGAAVAEPERFARLVLLNTAAFLGPIPWRIHICRVPGLGAFLVRGLNGFSLAALRMASAHPKRLSAAARAGLIAPYDSWAHRVAVHRFVQDIPQSPRDPSYADIELVERSLPRLAGLPTMFVWGMRDWCFTPWFLDRFVQKFPAAEVHRLTDVGHYVMEDAPQQVVGLVADFLQRNPLARATGGQDDVGPTQGRAGHAI